MRRSLLSPALPLDDPSLTLGCPRRFLKEFSRRPPVSTSDQVRVINDFLDFIAGKMRTVDPWKSLLDVDRRDDPERAEAEFDLTLEAMEKLVMNRLWHLCVLLPAKSLSKLRVGP